MADETRVVEVEAWRVSLAAARDEGFTFFDWLTAVDRTYDEAAPGFDVTAHLLDVGTPGALRGILLVTRVADGAPVESVTGIFAGAAWHERETYEMFGIDFAGFDDGSGLPIRPAAAARRVRGHAPAQVLPARRARLQGVARRQGARRGPRLGQGARPSPRAGARRAPARVGPAMSVLEVTVRAVAVLLAFLTLPLLVGQTEHKLMAHMQGRLGPMYAGGYHGWAQLVADGVKFVQKEDITPRAADKWVFRLAPAVALIPYLVALATIPIAPGVAAIDVPASVVLVLAATSVGALGTLMAGWASANKYALLGGLRAAAQLVSYELPIVLAVASMAMAGGSLSLLTLTDRWSPWWMLWQLPGAVVFLVAAVAELQRPPFDMPVADAELVMGAWTEYTGLRFAFFLLAEYAGIVVMSLLFSSLWLGGWHGPFSDTLGWLWTLLKGFVVAVCVIWVRVAWPRLREDQLQRLAWLWLVPLALLQLMVTGVGVVLGW